MWFWKITNKFIWLGKIANMNQCKYEKLYIKGNETVIYCYAIPQRGVMDCDRYVGWNENVGFM